MIVIIVLTLVNALMHLFAILLVLIWRKTNCHYLFRIDTSKIGFGCLACSVMFFLLLTIFGFINQKNDKAFSFAIMSLLFCTIFLFFFVFSCCYFIALDGEYVIKKRFSFETRIDLKEKNLIIDTQGIYNGSFSESIISNITGKSIVINYPQYNYTKPFFDECKKRHEELINAKQIEND